MRERIRRNEAKRTTGWRLTTLSLVAAGAVWVVGCGNLTAGGATGEAEVAVSGDATEEADGVSPHASRAITVSETDSGLEVRAPVDVGGPVEGEVTATLRVFLEDADGARTPLVGDDARAEVDVQGRTEVELGGAELDPGLYPRIRIVFTDIEADVRSGLVIGGNELTGRIGVGGQELDSLVVEVDREVRIGEDEVVRLLIDLNSTAWLNAANPALRTVATAIFREAVDVRVR